MNCTFMAKMYIIYKTNHFVSKKNKSPYRLYSEKYT